MNVMGVRRWVAGALAIVGGGLMVFSGYVSRGFLYQALGYAAGQVPGFLNGLEATAVLLPIIILEYVIALGGITVIIGGLVILARHTRTGRILILLGGGGGFLGLIIAFGLAIYKLGGLDPVLAYLPYWVGLVMAAVGRRVAKGQ